MVEIFFAFLRSWVWFTHLSKFSFQFVSSFYQNQATNFPSLYNFTNFCLVGHNLIVRVVNLQIKPLMRNIENFFVNLLEMNYNGEQSKPSFCQLMMWTWVVLRCHKAVPLQWIWNHWCSFLIKARIHANKTEELFSPRYRARLHCRHAAYVMHMMLRKVMILENLRRDKHCDKWKMGYKQTKSLF